ncbi:MAG: hypothetical protein AABZ32_04070, partial [Bacteroidota bacterium]
AARPTMLFRCNKRPSGVKEGSYYHVQCDFIGLRQYNEITFARVMKSSHYYDIRIRETSDCRSNEFAIYPKSEIA